MDIAGSQLLLKFVQDALAEDVGDGDHTTLSTIDPSCVGQAKLIAKENGLIAGVAVALQIINIIDAEMSVTLLKKDGDAVSVGDIVLLMEGKIHTILKAERLVLNIMQRMSGIATNTAKIVALVQHTSTKVLDTRKTTPLLRFLEKEAVKIGGGVNHRFGLYDMILIKDNHVDYAGGITQALEAANNYRKNLPKPIDIEIEVRNFEELQEVLTFGQVERIMFDNFSVEEVRKAVKIVNNQFITEASGGITLETIREYAETGVNFISVGALTHSVKSLDLSLKAKLV
ncbi:carboxylating nicotinate-nucleotide diphosphorylase [Sphingobacteriaceae bacterium WQ 2009]|uniref:Probable nicotinate-nucleotide pyrophosphorylase [carboxylating] n=1 Tax=Rhinopithecimicrobium faecis TaxID=2820698 RepID=A0A8T4HAU5_9SPHI|nr:carboxylating nicotinate-nucleotide diphosphorylase [Sphingobacteriaceae bacterium WQ 2009]